MPIETMPFDAAEFLDTPEAASAFLDEALATGDSRYIAHAVGVIARSHGMVKLADETNLHRPALYRAFSRTGNPTIETFFKTLNALGVKLVTAEG